MGFSTLLDILGALVIGGLMLTILFRLNDKAITNNFEYGGEVIVQKNLVEVVELLEYDFRKIGYCADWEQLPDPSRAILSADSNSIDFLTDVDNDGIVDTLHYYLGDTSELSGTPNENDRLLYRVVNSDPPLGSNMGITGFEFIYFNALGDTISYPITDTGVINTMQIDIRIEDTVGYNLNYSSIFWRQIRISNRNLRNR